MTFEEAESYVHSKFRKGSTPGLHRIRALLDKMGHPEKNLKFIHIAGTNGKGSTAAMTTSILSKAGLKAGLFTSPFIYRFNERMQISGRQIADEDVVDLVTRIAPLVEEMEEPVTEFELVTCMAFDYFARQSCDLVVLEVGMGGLNDATNIIGCPEVAVITNIGLDHTDALGDTVEKIAVNKAGIFKDGGHAVVYRGEASVEAVYEEICAQRNISLKKADFDSLKLKKLDLFGQVFDCAGYENLELPLLGDHQMHNAAVVLAIIETLQEMGWPISEAHIREGLAAVTWPGRFDIVRRDPLFIIDGGHNPQCIDALEKNIRDYLAGRRIIALTGVLTDKDYVQMYRPVMPYVDTFVCITPPNPRKLEAELLAQHLIRAGAKAIACNTMDDAVASALALAGEDGVVLCFGSLYTICDIRQSLDRQ